MMKANSSSSLLTLWYKPRQTLQGLIANGKGRTGAMTIAACFGLVQAWPSYAAREASGPGLLLLGAAAALAGLFLFSWLLRNFSRWFGATSRLAEVRTALGWGLLPWTLLFGLLLAFISAQDDDARQLFPLFFGALLYGFIILLLTLATALRLSLLKTFFCLLITFLVSIFPLTFIIQFVLGVSPPNA